ERSQRTSSPHSDRNDPPHYPGLSASYRCWRTSAPGGRWPVPDRHRPGGLDTTPQDPVSTPAPPLTAVLQLPVRTTGTRSGPDTVPSSIPGRRAGLPTPHKRHDAPVHRRTLTSAPACVVPPPRLLQDGFRRAPSRHWAIWW